MALIDRFLTEEKKNAREARRQARERRLDPSADNIRIGMGNGANSYAEEVEAAHGMDSRARTMLVIAVVLLVLYALGLVVPKNILNTLAHDSGMNQGYSFAWFVEDLGENVAGLFALATGNFDKGGSSGYNMILYVIVALTGAGMALSGAVYQSTFKNALVTPSTLGVMRGASLGMLLWVLIFVSDGDTDFTGLSSAMMTALNSRTSTGVSQTATPPDLLAYLWGNFGLAIMSFAGCVLVVALVLLAVHVANHGSANGIIMIITGQVLGAVLGAFSQTIVYYYITEFPDSAKAELLQTLQISSFYRTFSLADIALVGGLFALVLFGIMKMRAQLELLAFTEGEARTMGVDVKRVRYSVIALCTLLTAVIVSFCGHVGFVGFLVPHMARRLVGPDLKYLLPAACLLGAVFVLGAYLLTSVILGPEYETMCGMFISIFGCVVFLATAFSGKGGARGEFR